jgi:pyruvate dehydrogenase E1 component beta subunit
MTKLTLSKAINEGLRRALEDNPKAMIMGEDVGRLGGVFRVTDGLQKDFGEHRVMDTPLAESGIIGTAIGLALRGYRPVCEIQFDGFVYPATDQIVSQLAKMHYRSQGKVTLPVLSASRSAAASARSSTTASPLRSSSPTRPGCGWSPAPTPRTLSP